MRCLKCDSVKLGAFKDKTICLNCGSIVDSPEIRLGIAINDFINAFTGALEPIMIRVECLIKWLSSKLSSGTDSRNE